jgi:type IV pilus assembly protein PilP
MMAFKQRSFCQINKMFFSVGCCFLFMGLVGCSNDDMSDLTQYIQAVKAKPKGTIQPLPEIKIVEPFIFNPEGLRDPFQPVEIVSDDEVGDVAVGAGMRPDTSRRKEELEAYSLDTLRMVGTLTMDNGLWALIKASDGTIHRVKKGNHLGRNHGEIIRILDNRIELMEIVSDKPGIWHEQQASLALAE